MSPDERSVSRPVDEVFKNRAERYIPKPGVLIVLRGRISGGKTFEGHLVDLSRTGFQFVTVTGSLHPPLVIEDLAISAGNRTIGRLQATVAWVEEMGREAGLSGMLVGAARFPEPLDHLVTDLQESLVQPTSLRDDLDTMHLSFPEGDGDIGNRTPLNEFYRRDAPDLLQKCAEFQRAVESLQGKRLFQMMYRVTAASRIDHRTVFVNPLTHGEQEMTFFDSASLLGLHLHPRVLEKARKTIEQTGCGTPNPQLLSGTTRQLRELEEVLCRFHGREEAIVFPSEYMTGFSAIASLVRRNDLVIRDRLSHPAIQDGCRRSDSRFVHSFPHNDMAGLEDLLRGFADEKEVQGRLIATAGMFPTNGGITPLPELVRLSKAYGARLLVDEGHATGVLGASGGGTEDHFGLPGSIDILTGNLAASTGIPGGYICGSKDLVGYLRFFGHPGLFTSAMPAHLCAAIAEAFRVMKEEPEHRGHLWRNVREFVPALRQAGFTVSREDSPIVTLFLGTERLMGAFTAELFTRGIRCGTVTSHDEPDGEAFLRLAVNARHSHQDLDGCVKALAELGKKYGILGRSPQEIREISRKLAGGGTPG